jgi:mannose-1-phosphate guanylyltransferase
MIPALVLTAGLATRLRPLSHVRAKAALPVAGRPLVHRIIHRLADANVRDLVLNLHHLPHTITRVVGDGAELDVRVRYSWETPVLGSAGGPRHALPLLAAPTFLIVNGDTLTDVDIRAVVDAHQHSGASVTMALVVNTEPHKYGGVLVEEASAVTGFTKKGSGHPSFRRGERVDRIHEKGIGPAVVSFHRRPGGRGRRVRLASRQHAARVGGRALSRAHARAARCGARLRLER